jgi:hypothetical protein
MPVGSIPECPLYKKEEKKMPEKELKMEHKQFVLVLEVVHPEIIQL